MIKAVIFDMDGVVVDTSEFNFNVDSYVMSTAGANITFDSYKKYFGMPASLMYEAILGDEFHVKNAELIALRSEKLIEQLKIQSIEPKAGFTNLVENLKNLGIAVALATSSKEPRTSSILNAIGVLDLFSVKVTGGDVSNNKPAPDVYVLANKLLALDSSECIAVEDSATGITAAKSAGLYCAALKTSLIPESNLANSDVVVDNFEQLYSLIINLNSKFKNNSTNDKMEG